MPEIWAKAPINPSQCVLCCAGSRYVVRSMWCVRAYVWLFVRSHIYILCVRVCVLYTRIITVLESAHVQNHWVFHILYIAEKQRHNVKKTPFTFSIFGPLALARLLFSMSFGGHFIVRSIYLLLKIVDRLNTCSRPQCRYILWIDIK